MPLVLLALLLFIGVPKCHALQDIEVLDPLPEVELTSAHIIDVLIEYEVILEDNPTFCSQFYGLTDYSTRTISICASYDMTQRRKTLLHEILHVVYHKMGIETGGNYEPLISAKAGEAFKRLYGPGRK